MTDNRNRLTGTVYLLHFDQPLAHARHYMGFAVDLPHRIADHQAGNGSRLMQVVMEHQIAWVLARTWPGTRSFERQLKNRHNGPRLCPICKQITKETKP